METHLKNSKDALPLTLHYLKLYYDYNDTLIVKFKFL